MENKKGFMNGIYNLPIKDLGDVRREICHQLGIKEADRASWSKLKRGLFINRPSLAEVDAIERIFKDKGVTEIWD